MKTTDRLPPQWIRVLVLSALSLALIAEAAEPRTDLVNKLVDQGPHHRTWSQTRTNTLPDGTEREHRSSFTELSVGLNVFDSDARQWRPAVPEWEVFADGLVARRTQTRVILAPNIHRNDAVDVLTPDGLRLVSRPVSLGFFDPVTGQQALVAEIQDCVATQGASNEIVFANCFRGARASLRYTIRLAGLSQDLLLHERLVLPDGFSEESRLELYTEFDAATPEPVKQVQVVRRESEPLLRAIMAEPDLTDTTLRFGASRIRPGRVFTRSGRADGPRVYKNWIEANGLPVLVEAVEWRDFTPLLAALPPAPAKQRSAVWAVNQTRSVRREAAQSSTGVAPASPVMLLPAASEFSARLAAVTRPKGKSGETAHAPDAHSSRLQLAQAPKLEHAAGWDYELDGYLTDFVFRSDETYVIPSWVGLVGDNNVLEGGTVIKIGAIASGIYVEGTLRCATTPYRPAFITAQDDNTVGTDFSANPLSGWYGWYGLSFASGAPAASLHDVRFRHLDTAVWVWEGTNNELRNITVVNGHIGVYQDSGQTAVRNALFSNVQYPAGGYGTVPMEHATIDQANAIRDTQNPSYLTNCLLTRVSSTNGLVGPGNWVGTTNLFQTVGAGTHYLATDATTCRDQGTTNIAPGLLDEFQRAATTYPPILLTNAITSNTWLMPVVPREDSRPDIGYHYPVAHYALNSLPVTNGVTVNVAPGTVLLSYGSTTLWLQDHSQLFSEGTPTQRIHFTRYSAVQEEVLAWGAAWDTSICTSHFTNAPPTGRFRFTDFDGLAGMNYHLYIDRDTWNWSSLAVLDGTFNSGIISVAGPASSHMGWTNNLFERVRGWMMDEVQLDFYNNHVQGSSDWLFYNSGTNNTWQLHDNVFAGTLLANGGTMSNSHNAYLDLPDADQRLFPTNASDVVLTGFTFQPGPLGDYYQLSTNLLNKGSRLASAAGLYHYTTTTNQVIEGTTTNDIGLHYIAVDGNASTSQPLDSDADGVANWQEDANGNGAQDVGETSVTRADSPFVPRDYEPLGPCSRRTPLVISEIMYNPTNQDQAGEFIELYNTHHLPQDISGFRLTIEQNRITYTFSNTVVQPNAFVYVLFTSNLNNGSDTIRLLNKGGGTLLEVEYEDDFPWPVVADGAGHSLVLAKPSYGENDFRAWAASERIGGSPGYAETNRTDRLRAIVINEFLADPAGGAQEDFIELHNRSNEAIDVSGCYLSDFDEGVLDRFPIPPGTVIPPRGFIHYRRNDPPYPASFDFNLAAGGERVLLTAPDLTRVLDAVRFGGQSNGVSMGRSPDGAPWFTALLSQTPGATNSGRRSSDVIISEIMFNPLSGDDNAEFIELHNRTASPIIVTNWRIDGVGGFTIPANTPAVPANGFLVVGRSNATLRTLYSNLNSDNAVGDYRPSSLGNRVQRLVLSRLRSSGDPVVMDELIYHDGGQWSRWTDADGSSLELKDDRGDRRRAPNWTESAAPTTNAWVTIQTSGRVQLGDTNAANVIEISLIGAGECLVDDVQVFTNGVAKMVLDSGFGGTNNWSLEGNHYLSTITNGHLHLRTDGGGDYLGNRVAGKLSASIPSNTLVTITASTRWLRGSPEILLRLRGNGLEIATNLMPPLALGTPALANSAAATNVGPAIFDVSHFPPVPAAGEPVLVTARAEDPDGVTNMLLRHRVDPLATLTNVTMRDDGAGGDALAGDGLYSATLTNQSAGALVAFRVEATDSFGMTSRFPTEREMYPGDSERRECLVRFGDPQKTSSFGVYRMWMTKATADQWATRSRFQINDYGLDVTVICGTERVIYNATAAFGGSDNTSVTHDSPTNTLCVYRLHFPKDDRFLGADEALWDWPIKDRTGQREQMAYWMANELGLPVNYRRFVHLYVNGRAPEQRPNANGNETARIYEDAQTPDGDYLEQWFPNDSTGDLYKLYVWRQAFPEYSLQSMTSTNGYSQQHANLLNYTNSTGKNLPSYRWTWRKRAVQDSPHNYTNLFALVDAFNFYTNYIASVEAIADAEQWARVFAANRMVGNLDVYQNLNGQNMYAYKPPSSRWVLLPYDMDLVMGQTSDSTNTLLFTASVYTDPRIRELITTNTFFGRAYWRAFQDAVSGPLQSANHSSVVNSNYSTLLANGVKLYSGANVVSPWDTTNGFTTWLDGRRNFISSELNKLACGFAITNNNGSNFSTSASSVLLAGKAPPQVKFIALNGTITNVTWHTVTNWSLAVTLHSGANYFTNQGYDRFTNVLSGTNATITITNQP